MSATDPRTASIAVAIADTDHHVLAHQALVHTVRALGSDRVFVFSDRPEAWPGFDVIRIPTLRRIEDYNRLVLRRLPEVLDRDHVLVVQYDGFVLHPERFEAAFLEQDYLGAPWPNFPDRPVGNGGFSLRSRRLVEAVATLDAGDFTEAEDLFICHRHGPALEARGLRFGPRELAARFSVEWPKVPHPTFGFHGIFHLPEVYRNHLDFLVEHLSDRIITQRAGYLLPFIERLSPQAGAAFRARQERLLAQSAATPASAAAPLPITDPEPRA